MLNHVLNGALSPAGDQRATDRRRIRLTAQATGLAEGGLLIHNLSRTGMLVETAQPFPVGTLVDFELPEGGSHRVEVVWADDTLFGGRFVRPLSQAQLSAALLRSPPEPAAQQGTRRLSQDEALARLLQHWEFEDEPEVAAPQSERKLPPGKRLWTIAALALASWSLPLAAALVWF